MSTTLRTAVTSYLQAGTLAKGTRVDLAQSNQPVANKAGDAPICLKAGWLRIAMVGFLSNTANCFS
jgi:hypothetical protein